MDNKRSGSADGKPTAGDTARHVLEQSMYRLVRLTRLGLQAAASGFGRLEETMAQKQRERAAPRGEAPPAAARPTGEAPPRAGQGPGEDSGKPGA